MAAAGSVEADAGSGAELDVELDDLGSVAAGSILVLGGLVRGGFLGKLVALGGVALAVSGLRSAARRDPASRNDAWDDASGAEGGVWERSAEGRAARDGGYYRHADEGAGDVVTEASEESFPASDSPSWTPTTGSSERGEQS